MRSPVCIFVEVPKIGTGKAATSNFWSSMLTNPKVITLSLKLTKWEISNSFKSLEELRLQDKSLTPRLEDQQEDAKNQNLAPETHKQKTSSTGVSAGFILPSTSCLTFSNKIKMCAKRFFKNLSLKNCRPSVKIRVRNGGMLEWSDQRLKITMRNVLRFLVE